MILWELKLEISWRFVRREDVVVVRVCRSGGLDETSGRRGNAGISPSNLLHFESLKGDLDGSESTLKSSSNILRLSCNFQRLEGKQFEKLILWPKEESLRLLEDLKKTAECFQSAMASFQDEVKNFEVRWR
jgi:hypothetical protein